MAISKSAQIAPAPSAATKRVEPSQKKDCFVISPIGLDDSDTRKRADQVLRHIIKKALSDTYAVERADDISKPGLITLQIIERLMKAPMVVADLTDANANVYYELAIRHFVKKPVVHLITEGQKPPFDVAQMRYISYDLTDPDSVESAAQEVRDHATACERGEVPFTPIQFVEMLDTARGEGEDQFVSLALGIQSALSNLQSDVRQVGDQVNYLAAITEEDRPGFTLPSRRGLGFGSLRSMAGASGLGASGLRNWPLGPPKVVPLDAAEQKNKEAKPIGEPIKPPPDSTPKDEK